MSIEEVRTYAKLDQRKRELDRDLLAVKGEMERIRPRVLEFFQREGLDRIALDGVTLYIRRELWANRNPDVELEVAIEALDRAGLADYAGRRINTQKLSAYVRDLERENEPLPEDLRGVIAVNEVFKVGSRSG